MNTPYSYAHTAAMIADAMTVPIYKHTEPEEIPLCDIQEEIANWAIEWVDSGKYENCTDLLDSCIRFAQQKALEKYGLPILAQLWDNVDK